MQLAVHASGSGHETALLIHGMNSHHRAWHSVSDALVDAGYRVISVDLAGHGESPRAQRYSPKQWARDIVESIAPWQAEPLALVMGHSLGGLVAAEFVAAQVGADRMPARVIYVDPAFHFPRGLVGAAVKLGVAVAPRPRRAAIARRNPRWSHEDVEIEVESLALWDRRTLFGMARSSWITPPTELLVPSLVVRAEKSYLVPEALAERLLDEGYDVETIAGAGHNIHRDQPERFLDTIISWLRSPGTQQAGDRLS